MSQRRGAASSHRAGTARRHASHRDAGITRIDASESFSLGTQKFAYDANTATEYAHAVADGDEQALEFLRTNLVRPEFLPVLDRWEASVRAGDDSFNIFTDEEYLDILFADSTAKAAESDAALERSSEASDNADDYLLLTLFTATALFFAGVTTSFASRPARSGTPRHGSRGAHVHGGTSDRPAGRLMAD